MKKICSFVLCVVLILSTLAGCGGKTSSETPLSPDKSEDAASESVVKDTITFAYEAEPANIATTENNAISAYYLSFMIYSGLFKSTENGIEKDLCTEYHVEKDANGEETIWYFKLREGVKFSDGSDLTAQDVADTLMYAQTRPIVAKLTSWYTSAEAVDETTVKIVTNGVYSAVPAALSNKACYILPSELIAAEHDFGNEPVGSGPYKLEEWAKGEQIRLVINENYYDQENFPVIKEIIWKIIPEGPSRTMALEAGEVDFVINVAPVDVARVEEADDLVMSITPGGMLTFVNLDNVLYFDDVNLRKAFSAAINRDAIVKVAMNGYAESAYSCFPIIMDGYTEEEAVKYDPAKAKEYLAAWGGDPASLDFTIYMSNDVRRRAAEVIQSNLKEIGINCSIEQIDNATQSSMQNNYELVCSITAYTTNDLLTYMNAIMASSGSAHRQGGLDMDSLIKSISDIIDDDARRAQITSVNKTINDAQPIIPLFQNQMLIAYKDGLKNVAMDSMGFFRVENFAWN